MSGGAKTAWMSSPHQVAGAFGLYRTVQEVLLGYWGLTHPR